MDILKGKYYRSVDYVSRYPSFPYYYNSEDDKYVYGLTSHLLKNTPYATVEIKQGDTLDSLANRYYGRPDLYWVIGEYNDIMDVFEPLYGKYKTLNIPSLGSIKFK